MKSFATDKSCNNHCIMDNDYIGSPKEFYTSVIYFNDTREKEITDILHTRINPDYRNILCFELNNMECDWDELRHHKHKYFFLLSGDLYKVMHKRKYYKSLHSDLLPIAWHPERYLDWCIDEEEKRDLKVLWGV